MTAQLPLDLGHRPALGRADFLVGPANREAVAWIDRWPDWPAAASGVRGLALVGAPGSGKSHLAAAWQARSGASAIATAAAAGAATADAVLIDAPSLPDPEIESALFLLYERLGARRGSILLVTTLPPTQTRFALPDLGSRLATFPVAALAAPDDVLLAGLLAKLFADRQLRVAPEVVAYLLPRMERSFAAAQALVAALDARALAERRPVTVALAGQVLGAIEPTLD